MRSLDLTSLSNRFSASDYPENPSGGASVVFDSRGVLLPEMVVVGHVPGQRHALPRNFQVSVGVLCDFRQGL